MPLQVTIEPNVYKSRPRLSRVLVLWSTISTRSKTRATEIRDRERSTNSPFQGVFDVWASSQHVCSIQCAAVQHAIRLFYTTDFSLTTLTTRIPLSSILGLHQISSCADQDPHATSHGRCKVCLLQPSQCGILYHIHQPRDHFSAQRRPCKWL